MASVAKLKEVHKEYGGQVALGNVNLRLESERFYALVGENGAGKSTLLKLIMNHEHAGRGVVKLFGESVDKDQSELRGRVGYVSEHMQMFLPLGLREFVNRYRKMYAQWDETIFDEIFQRSHIDPYSRFNQLSRGQKMQFVMGLALSIRPKLLLVDEATAVMDLNARKFFASKMLNVKQNGGTVVYATNIVDELDYLVDDLIVLKTGNVVMNVKKEDIPKIFIKLRHPPEVDHEIFERTICACVGSNSDGSLSYIVPRGSLDVNLLPKELIDRRSIRMEEIFIYASRSIK